MKTNLQNQDKYDLVITDLSMPRLDGIELSKRIMQKNPNQIIIVISAHTESKKLTTISKYRYYKIPNKTC